VSERFDDIADRLDAIAEEIAEAAIDELRAALHRGDGKRPALEKRLTQSRRAVEKAAHVLRGIDDESDDTD